MANASNRYSGAPAPAAPSEKIMTPANVVTLVRICLVPVFVAALVAPWPELLGLDHLLAFKPWIAAAIFVVIACTDWLDGYLARSRNEVTDFGKFMDPLADKVLVVAALLVLIELGSLPSWPVLIIVAREFIVSGVRMVAASKGEVIAASWYGKFKTVFQMIAIVLFVVKESPIIESVSHTLYVGVYLLSLACDDGRLSSHGVFHVGLHFQSASSYWFSSERRRQGGCGAWRRGACMRF